MYFGEYAREKIRTIAVVVRFSTFTSGKHQLSRAKPPPRLRGYDRSLFPIFCLPGRFAAPRTTMINIDAGYAPRIYPNYANFSRPPVCPAGDGVPGDFSVRRHDSQRHRPDVSSCRNNAARRSNVEHPC